MIGLSFVEVMQGTLHLDGERFDRPFGFKLDVAAPDVTKIVTSTAVGQAAGRLTADGFASDVPATGRLEMSPIKNRTLRYVLDFTSDDGRRCTFDGHKTIRWLSAISSWTTLPGDVADEHGKHVADAVLRFSLRRDLGALLKSSRLPRAKAPSTA
jgi:hypothetical protein